jgi:hypothetical protein
MHCEPLRTVADPLRCAQDTISENCTDALAARDSLCNREQGFSIAEAQVNSVGILPPEQAILETLHCEGNCHAG